MQLTKIQKQILDSPARFKCIVAGRRGGKTYTSIAAVAQQARFPNRKVMMVFPSYRMAKQIVFDDLCQLLKEKRWLKKINQSDLTFTLVNNSIIMLRSADNPDSIRGVGLDFVVIDEAADIDEEAWTAVIRPTLSDREGSAMIIGTPKGRNFFYTMYHNAKHYDDWFCLQFTTAQGGNVSEEELAQARQDLAEKTYKQEYEAEFVDYAGVIYYAFDTHNIKSLPQPTDARTPLHIGMDFNVLPFCAVIAYQHSGGLHIFDEIEIHGTDTTEVCAEIQQRYPGRRIVVYPDSAGAQRRTSASGGITDHIILRNAGFDVKVGSINPAVKDRIAAVNSVLKEDNCRLTIDSKCKSTIECLRKQVYKPETTIPEKSGFDHMNDALGYMVNHLYPLRVEFAQGAMTPQRRSTGKFRK